MKSQPFVDTNAIGIRGLSWGGYATVMTTALLGRQVKAGVAVYGSGFYDLPSYFKTLVDKLDEPARRTWLASLDAGRYAGLIQAPFYRYRVQPNAAIQQTWVWYSVAGSDWTKRTWHSVVPLAVGRNRYRATLPAPPSGATLNWYVTVTDDNAVSNGTVIH